MGVRATCTHKTSESNDTIRVDLIGQAYGGASREVIGNGRTWMRFSHDQLDYANVFNTPVQRGRLEFSFMVQSDDDRSVVTDVLATAQGEYTMAYYRNGTLQWIGEVMMDQLGSLSVGEPYPYAVTLVARDFVPLEGQLFPLEDNRQLATTVLGRLLSATGYDLPIWTHTSWTTTGTTSANDFLRQVYVDTRNLREFNKEGDIQITYLEALTRMVAPFKAVLRQAGGVFVLDQLSAYETPSSVLRTIYDKDGAYQSQSNVNTTVSANSSVNVVRGSIDEIKPGYKRAAITYNHRTPQGDIRFPDRITLDPAGISTFAESEFIPQDKVLTLTGRASVSYTNGAIIDPFRPSALIEIKHLGGSGTLYWNNALQEWQSVQITNTFEMSASNDRFGDNTAQSGFNTRVNIETTATEVSGELEITLFASPVPSGRKSFTSYVDFEFIVVEEEEDKATTAIRYVTEQALSFTQNYDGGSYYFGDGPTVRSSSAIRRSTTTTDLTTSWTRRGDSDDWEFHEIALKEIMDHYRGYGRVGSYIIKQGNYTPLNVLAFETRALYYVGGQFDGFTGWWSPILFQLDLVTGTDQLVVGYVSGPSLITSTTLTAVSLATNNSIEANANYVFRLATQVSGTVTQLSLEPMNVQYPLLRKDTIIRVVHPVTLEQYNFTLAQDMLAGSLTVPVVSTTITNPLPRGSYIYTNPGDGAAALIIGQDSIRLIAETASVGVTTTESLGPVTSIEVVLNTRVQAGDDLFLVRTLDARKLAFTVDQTVGPGLVTLQLNQLTTFDAPAGSYIIGSNAKYEGLLQVTPAGVLAKAEAVTTQNSFAILSAPLPSGTSTNGIPIVNTSVRSLKLLDGSQIGVQDRAGNTEFFEIDGEQDIDNATNSITVVSKAPSVNIGAGAGVFQPMWNQTAILSVQAGEIATRLTELEVQTLINDSIAGVLPAVVFNFDNTTEGFTTNSVTLTAAPTVVEYLATGSTPYIQKALDTSYVAAENPVVTIRVQRIAGTNWGGAFGWSTDGTNFDTQTFLEPTNLDSELSFTTIDLTSNVDYTGTITHIRIYLGEANLDEFEIDQFTIGKYNPQTEILEDLSTRLTVAEAGLTNTANEFTTYTQNGVLLNGSAKVNQVRNATTMYDTVIITDTRGGFTVKNNQDYYLVNTDGTFQAVKIRDDQTIADESSPTNVTLKIQSITFATTIQVGAMLYESAFTQSTRISQSAGQIVLKATESSPSSGYVDSIALVSLSADISAGSQVKIIGDKIELNNIEFVRDNSSGLVQTKDFVSGSTGWRIRGTGDAEFNDVTVRGSVFVTGGDAATQTYADTVAQTAEDNANTNISIVNYARQRVFRQDAKPTSSGRPDLGTGFPANVFLAGDIWIDTNDGDAPWTYDVSTSDFIRTYTRIDGGSIVTGTVDTNRLNVSNIITVGSIATETYADTVGSNTLAAAESYADAEALAARNAARNNIAAQLGYTDYDTMVADAAADGTIIDGGFIRTTLIDVDNLLAVNASITATLSIGTNGVIKLEESSVNKYGIGKNGLALTSAITSSTSNSRLEFRDDPVLASTGLNTGANPTRLYLEAISPTGTGIAELWSAYNFSFKGVSGVTFLFENKVASSVAADSDNDLLRRTDGDSRYARLGSANTFTANQTITGNLILGTSTNKATITYATDTARTLTIPNVGGNRTFAFIDQAQTFTANQTFNYNNFYLRNNADTFSANVRYNGTANRNITFPDNGGTVAIIEAGQTYTGNNEFDGQTIFDNKYIKWSNRASVGDAGSDYGRLYVDSDGYVRVLLPPP